VESNIGILTVLRRGSPTEYVAPEHEALENWDGHRTLDELLLLSAIVIIASVDERIDEE
jgi:hypothetical protein